MSVPEVLAAAADEIESREPHHRDRDYRGGAGGQVYADLFEAARRLYGWPAVVHLQHHLRGDLPGGQLQHWRETDPAVVVKTLREAAGVTPAADVEVVALRAQMADVCARLAAAMGWLHESPEVLVGEVVERLHRLESEVRSLRKRLLAALLGQQGTTAGLWIVAGGTLLGAYAGCRWVQPHVARMLAEEERPPHPSVTRCGELPRWAPALRVRPELRQPVEHRLRVQRHQP